MRLRLAALCLAGVVLARPVTAGPIGIDVLSGQTSQPVTANTGAVLTLFADEFSLMAALFGGAGFFSPAGFYTPGTTVAIHAGWSGMDAPGSFTYLGQTVQLGTANGPGLVVDFLSDPFVIPAIDGSPLVTVPFTLNGSIQSSSQFPDGFTLHGNGRMDFTVSAPLTLPSGAQLWSIGAAQFTFEPVPEPSAFILLGTGLSGLVVAARRRRRQRDR